MQRIQSFDLARGFTVLIMPMIHVVMLYSQPEVQQSLLGDILGFIAEGPGAQLFMLLMGVGFTISKRISKKQVLQRALSLLAAGYTLNFLKFIVPFGLGLIPENLLQELQLKNDFSAVKFFLLIGDILHFAGLAYLMLFLVYKLKYYPYWSFTIATAIMILSPMIWDLETGIPVIDHFLILFNGHPPQAFFPVFPWLVYPLIGLTLGYLVKHNNINDLLRKTGITGFAIIIISCVFPPSVKTPEWLPFYRTAPADTLFHLGFVLVWLALFHWLNKKIPANFFFRLLTFCSRQITAIYIIQWVLICWCMAFTGYLQLNFIQTISWMAGITIITLILTYGITKSNASRKSI